MPSFSPLGIDRGIAHVLAFSALIDGGKFADFPVEMTVSIEKKTALQQAKLVIKTKFTNNWRRLHKKMVDYIPR